MRPDCNLSTSPHDLGVPPSFLSVALDKNARSAHRYHYSPSVWTSCDATRDSRPSAAFILPTGTSIPGSWIPCPSTGPSTPAEEIHVCNSERRLRSAIYIRHPSSQPPREAARYRGNDRLINHALFRMADCQSPIIPLVHDGGLGLSNAGSPFIAPKY